MSSHYLDFSSCGIVPGFCKSGHIWLQAQLCIIIVKSLVGLSINLRLVSICHFVFSVQYILYGLQRESLAKLASRLRFF